MGFMLQEVTTGSEVSLFSAIPHDSNFVKRAFSIIVFILLLKIVFAYQWGSLRFFKYDVQTNDKNNIQSFDTNLTLY